MRVTNTEYQKRYNNDLQTRIVLLNTAAQLLFEHKGRMSRDTVSLSLKCAAPGRRPTDSEDQWSWLPASAAAAAAAAAASISDPFHSETNQTQQLKSQTPRSSPDQ